MNNPRAGYGQPLPSNMSPQMMMGRIQPFPHILLNNHLSISPRQMNGYMLQQGSQESNNNNNNINNNYFQLGQQNGFTSNGFIYGQPSPPYSTSTSPALSQNSSTFEDNYRGGNLPQGQCNSDTEVGRTSNFLLARPPSISLEQYNFIMQTTQHYENYYNRSLPDTQNNVAKKIAEQKEKRQKKEIKKRSNLVEQRMSNATGESGPREEQYMNYLMRANDIIARKIMYKEQRQQVQQQRSYQRQQQQQQVEIQQLPQSGQDASADIHVDENIMDENTLSPMNDGQQDSFCNENSDGVSESDGGGTAPVKIIDEKAYKTEPGWSVPKIDKKGEVCMIKCRDCDSKFETKVEMWTHLRKQHIEPAKLVTCTMQFCAFVTDVKHHLQYHVCLHTGERNFGCDQCPYRCINKAMLKSHKKSHSPNYDYYCADCPSRSKFHHAIKQHLEETGHRQGLTYDEDGNLCDKIIDVYGKRRGPRKATKKKSDTTVEPVAAIPAQVEHDNNAPLDLSKKGSNNTAINLSTTTVEIHSRPSTAEIHSRPTTVETVATPTESSPRVSGASKRKGKAVKCVRKQVEHKNHEFNSIIAIKEEPVDVAEPEIGNYY